MSEQAQATIPATSERPYGVIYKITCAVNGKIYVGQTRSTIKARWSGHVLESRKVKGKFAHLYHAIRKHGIQYFSIEEIDSATSEADIHAKEIFWIDALHATNREIGYNHSRGGEGRSHGLTSREKLSASRKRMWESPEYRAQMKSFNDSKRQETGVWLRAFYQTPKGLACREAARKRRLKTYACPQCGESFNGVEWQKHSRRITKCASIQPPVKNKTALANDARAHTPEEKREKSRQYWTPERRAAWSERMKAQAASNAAGRKKCSEASLEWWSNARKREAA